MINPNNPDFENTPVSPKRPKYEYVLKDTNTKPVVSIITPFYNAGEVFYETAQSIFQQSFQQWEWIIVNDGSTDLKSLETLNQFRKMDNRIRVIDHNKNLGRSAARNTGCKFSKSQYMIFIDADDMIETTTIEKWLWFLISHEEFAFVNSYVVAFGGKQYLWKQGFQDAEMFIRENRTVIGSAVRKDLLTCVGYFDEGLNYFEDWDFWLRCAYNGFWGYTIPEFIFWYRRKQFDNWSNGDAINKFQLNIHDKYPDLKERFPHIQKAGRNRYSRIIEVDELRLENNLIKTKNKKRILLIFPWMTIGGADNFNLNLVKQLSDNDWEVSIVCTEKNISHDISYKFYEYTPDIFNLPNIAKLNHYPAFFEYLINSRKFDYVLVSNSQIGYQMLPLIRTKFPNIICIDYNHTIDPGWMNDGYPNLSILYEKYLDLQMTTSMSLSEWMIQRGGNPQKIKECYINVDSKYYQPNIEDRIIFRKEMGINQEVPLIVFSGRFTQQKQPNIFIKVLNNIKNLNNNFKAVMLGDGPLFNSCQQLINDLHLDKIVLAMGAVDTDLLRRWFNAADIFFLPSAYEGISLALYEAMSFGLIPVVADVGGQKELVGDFGFLVKHDSNEVENYTAILIEILTNFEKYNYIGVSARQRIIEKFDISLFYNRFSELVSEYATSNHSCIKDNELAGYNLRLFLQEALEHYFMGQVADEIWFENESLKNDLMRTREFQQITPNNFGAMPPAPALTYLYFAIRAMVYPLYKKLPINYQNKLDTIKNHLKKSLGISGNAQ